MSSQAPASINDAGNLLAGLPFLRFGHLLQIYVDMFVTPSAGGQITLSDLATKFREFAQDNAWVRNNGMIAVDQIPCVGEGEKDVEIYRGKVQTHASTFLKMKFGDAVHYVKGRHGKGSFRGLQLTHPDSQLSQCTLENIPPDNIELDGLFVANGKLVKGFTPLSQFEWTEKGVPGGVSSESILGGGAFGKVFKGRLIEKDGSKRDVAVKFFKRGSRYHAADAECEATMMMKVNGMEGVVHLLGGSIGHFVEWKVFSLSYLVYELCRGNLKVVAVDSSVRLHHRIALLQDCIKASVRVHAKGLLHLDIRVPNILVKGCGGDARAILGDFGVARFADAVGVLPVVKKEPSTRYWIPDEYRTNQQGTWTDAYAISFLAASFFLPDGIAHYSGTSAGPLHAVTEETSTKWQPVLTWILLARAKEVEDRKPVSLLHLWYVLMAAIASDELGPPYGLFAPAVAPSAPLVALPAQQLPLLQDCALLRRPVHGKAGEKRAASRTSPPHVKGSKRVTNLVDKCRKKV
jgi:hypothetical protein